MKAIYKMLMINSLMVVAVVTRAQDDQLKSQRGGWAVHVGAGYIYGGSIGLLGERQILISDKFRISPSMASGVERLGTDSTGTKYYYLGFTGGFNLEIGKKHRLIFGPHFTSQSQLNNNLDTKKSWLPSGSLILGYRGMADFGLIWQIYIGDNYIQDAWIDDKKFHHTTQFGLGFGWIF